MVHWEWSLGGTNGVVRAVDEPAMQAIQLHKPGQQLTVKLDMFIFYMHSEEAFQHIVFYP